MISLLSTGIMLVAVAVLMVVINGSCPGLFAILPFVSITMVVVGHSMQGQFRSAGPS